MEIAKYDIIELVEDLNPIIRKGMRGTVLEEYTEDAFEIEVLDEKGNFLNFGNAYTFTVSKEQILIVEKRTNIKKPKLTKKKRILFFLIIIVSGWVLFIGSLAFLYHPIFLILLLLGIVFFFGGIIGLLEILFK